VTDVVATETNESVEEQPEKVFSQSILISGVRCLLTLIIGTIAILANIFSIRRFWKADHQYKVPVSILNVGIIVLLTILIIQDLNALG